MPRTAAIARARIALADGGTGAKAALASRAGFERSRRFCSTGRGRLRAEHQDDDAHAMLLRIDPTAPGARSYAALVGEVSVQARDALAAGDRQARAGSWSTMPSCRSATNMSISNSWRGFIALRFLQDPGRRPDLFPAAGRGNVSRPISKSRGEYWQGRAYEALGDTASAYHHYRLAAAYPETFYGQLAHRRARESRAAAASERHAGRSRAPSSEIENDPLMPQIRVLADLGQESDLRLFAERDAEVYSSPRHLKAFLQTLTEWGYPEIAVRLAKDASYAGAPMLDFTHPRDRPAALSRRRARRPSPRWCWA